MSEEKKPTYNLHVKKSLTLKQGAPIPDQVGMRGIFKDHKNFPKGTKYKWLLPPDTSQNKYTNAKIQVIFPDGTTRQHTVHYQIYVPGIKINQPRKKKKAKTQPTKPQKAVSVAKPQKVEASAPVEPKESVNKTGDHVKDQNKSHIWLIATIVVVIILISLALLFREYGF